MISPKYNIKVQLSGTDGNVFALIGKVSGALRKNNVPKEKIDQFQHEVMECGSYQEALSIMGNWVEVL